MASPKVSWQYEGPRGAVAQLGERQLCKLDVVGSIPISSTLNALKRISVAAVER